MADLTQSPCLSVPALGSTSPHSPFTPGGQRTGNCGIFATLPSTLPTEITPIRGTKRKPDHDAGSDDDMMPRSPSPSVRTLTWESLNSEDKSQASQQPVREPWRERVANARQQQRPEHGVRGSGIVHKHKRSRRGGTLGSRLPLSKLLEPLSKEQLVQVLEKLVEYHPEAEGSLVTLAPRPTLQSVAGILHTQHKKLMESFPYTKWGPATDDYSFRRVRPTLLELQDTVLHYADHFTSDEEFPTTAFTYLQQATEMALSLPEWDTATHNALRGGLLNELANFYHRTIHSAARRLSEGKLFGQQTVREWGRGLQQHTRVPHGQCFESPLAAFVQCFGWMLGLTPTDIPGLPNNSPNVVNHFKSSVTPH
ncbi:Tethering factor for nuclear proteasome sts1 [Dispira simplex]|nr:Tethering factor for nuclear proteasome sts1 [Dispira simplex]